MSVAALLVSARFAWPMLVLGLLLGTAGSPRLPADPALVFARAAGALCSAEATGGLPDAGHAHDQCLICQGSGPAAGMAAAPWARWMESEDLSVPAMPARSEGMVVRRAHGARAPPAGMG